MGKVVKVYKVKDTETGLYRTAGGGWSKTGKTWNNLGHLKASISSEGYFRKSSGERWDRKPKGEYMQDLPNPNWMIIEIIVEEREGNTRSMIELVEEIRRKDELAEKYGKSFADLVTRIEGDGSRDEWGWCLLIPFSFAKRQVSEAGEAAMKNEIKKRKLKQHKDYRLASSFNNGMAVAFKSKTDAAVIRLSLPTDVEVVSLDIKNFVEEVIDETVTPALSMDT